MRLTLEDRLRLSRLSHRTGERDIAKIVREGLREMEKKYPGGQK